jgi:hypothetical protein
MQREGYDVRPPLKESGTDVVVAAVLRRDNQFLSTTTTCASDDRTLGPISLTGNLSGYGLLLLIGVNEK